MTTAPAAPRTTPPPGLDGAMVPRLFGVVETRQDTHDTYTLWLEPADGVALDFAAGQFTMLQAFGVGEVPISISGDPAAPGLLQHTIRDVGSVSHALATASPGTTLGVRGPFGTGWEASLGRGGDVVFVAGGIGLAPLRPSVLEVCAHRSDYRRVSLLYGARTPEELLFGDDLRHWVEAYDIDVEVIVDNGQASWTGKVGLVTQLIDRAEIDGPRTLALTCGPEVMMRHVVLALLHRDVPATQLRLSMERNMKCGIGLCGHCQLREVFVCVDGPVLTYERLAPLMARVGL